MEDMPRACCRRSVSLGRHLARLRAGLTGLTVSRRPSYATSQYLSRVSFSVGFEVDEGQTSSERNLLVERQLLNEAFNIHGAISRFCVYATWKDKTG